MRARLLAPIAAALLVASHAAAQTADRPERGVSLTVFRSPATGLELRSGHAAAFAGYYPTVLRLNGENRSAHFVRLGGTYYLTPRGNGFFVSPSVVVSLSDDWRSGALAEAGFRGRIVSRVNGRLGAAVLATLDGRTRMSPTVGLDVPLGGAR